jgi:hypothetical protein
MATKTNKTQSIIELSTKVMFSGIESSIPLQKDQTRLIDPHRAIKLIFVLSEYQNHFNKRTDEYKKSLESIGVPPELTKVVLPHLKELADLEVNLRTEKDTTKQNALNIRKDQIVSKYLLLLDYSIIERVTGQPISFISDMILGDLSIRKDESRIFSSNLDVVFCVISQSQRLKELVVFNCLLQKTKSITENYTRYDNDYLSSMDGFKLLKESFRYTFEVGALLKLMIFVQYVSMNAQYFFVESTKDFWAPLQDLYYSESIKKGTPFSLSIADRLIVDVHPEITNAIFFLTKEQLLKVVELIKKIIGDNKTILLAKYQLINIISSLWFRTLYLINSNYEILIARLEKKINDSTVLGTDGIDLRLKLPLTTELKEYIQNSFIPELGRIVHDEFNFLTKFIGEGVIHKVLGIPINSDEYHPSLSFYQALYIENDTFDDMKNRILRKPLLTESFGNLAYASYGKRNFDPTRVIFKNLVPMNSEKKISPIGKGYSLFKLNSVSDLDSFVRILTEWSIQMFVSGKAENVFITKFHKGTWKLTVTALENSLMVLHYRKVNGGIRKLFASGEELIALLIRKDGRVYKIRPVTVYSENPQGIEFPKIQEEIGDVLKDAFGSNNIKYEFVGDNENSRVDITNTLIRSTDDSNKTKMICISLLWLLELFTAGLENFSRIPSEMVAANVDNTRTTETKSFAELLIARYFTIVK